MSVHLSTALFWFLPPLFEAQKLLISSFGLSSQFAVASLRAERKARGVRSQPSHRSRFSIRTDCHRRTMVCGAHICMSRKQQQQQHAHKRQAFVNATQYMRWTGKRTRTAKNYTQLYFWILCVWRSVGLSAWVSNSVTQRRYNRIDLSVATWNRERTLFFVRESPVYVARRLCQSNKYPTISTIGEQ